MAERQDFEFRTDLLTAELAPFGIKFRPTIPVSTDLGNKRLDFLSMIREEELYAGFNAEMAKFEPQETAAKYILEAGHSSITICIDPEIKEFEPYTNGPVLEQGPTRSLTIVTPLDLYRSAAQGVQTLKLQTSAETERYAPDARLTPKACLQISREVVCSLKIKAGLFAAFGLDYEFQRQVSARSTKSIIGRSNHLSPKEQVAFQVAIYLLRRLSPSAFELED